MRQVRDKEERRGILAEESETQEYQETREAHDASRREVLTEKERQEQLVREKEKAEYLEEVRRLELELELKIADANRLVDQVFAGFSGSVSEVPPPASLETVDEQIKALDEKAMGGRGYLEGASQAFLQLRKLEADLRADIGSRGAAKAQLSARIAEVQREITALKTGGLIKRFRARSEIAERQGRVGNMNRDIAASEKTVRKENSTLAKIAMQKLDFGGRVCDLLKREIDGTAAREIGQSLKELWDKVSGTTFFAEDVGAAYMEQVIAPAFDRVAAEREAHRHEHSFYRDMPGWYEAEKNRSRFFALLKKRLAGKNEEMGETEALREMMASLPSELSSVCQPLLQDVVFLGGRNAIKPIVRSLFAQYAAERISAAVDGVKKKKEKMSETEAADPADAHIRSQLMPDYALRFPESYDGLPSDVEWDIRSGGPARMNCRTLHYGRSPKKRRLSGCSAMRRKCLIKNIQKLSLGNHSPTLTANLLIICITIRIPIPSRRLCCLPQQMQKATGRSMRTGHWQDWRGCRIGRSYWTRRRGNIPN